MVTVGRLAWDAAAGEGHSSRGSWARIEVRRGFQKEQQEGLPWKEAKQQRKSVKWQPDSAVETSRGLRKWFRSWKGEKRVMESRCTDRAGWISEHEELRWSSIQEVPRYRDYNVPAVYDIIDPASNFPNSCRSNSRHQIDLFSLNFYLLSPKIGVVDRFSNRTISPLK